MKKLFLFLLLFSLLASTRANGNPLFADVVKCIIIGNLEYFYDSYGNVVVREDIGDAGYLYDNDGNAFACFSSDGNPYSNVGALYYDLDGNYMGKLLRSSSTIITGETIIKRTYLDHRNRPVATFVEQDTFGTMAEIAEAEDKDDKAKESVALSFLARLFGNSIGSNTGKTFVLSGRIQRYRN